MKFRIGFVSNSSSSSFTIKLSDLSAKQILTIVCHSELGKQIDIEYGDTDAWEIIVDERAEIISGNTSMNNFDMEEYLQKIGIPDNKINWIHGHW